MPQVHTAFLPNSTAIPALHFLSGTLPIEATIDIRVLTFLTNILVAVLTNTPPSMWETLSAISLQLKGQTQIAGPGMHRRGCSCMVLITRQTFWLACQARMPRKASNGCSAWPWSSKLQDEACSLTSLSNIILTACCTSYMHPVLTDLKCPLTIQKATVKSLLLVQRYPLSTCPVAVPNTVTYARCVNKTLRPSPISTVKPLEMPALPIPRNWWTLVGKKWHFSWPNNRHFSHPVSTFLQLDKHLHEKLCMDFCFKIHNVCAMLLSATSQYSKFKTGCL